MRHRVPLIFSIAITVVCLSVAGYFWFDNGAVPSVAYVAEERHSWHVPAPLNASLGFGKIYYVSLPSYVRHDFRADL